MREIAFLNDYHFSPGNNYLNCGHSSEKKTVLICQLDGKRLWKHLTQGGTIEENTERISVEMNKELMRC